MRFVFFCFLLILSACASKPPGTKRVFFPTASPRWMDDLNNGSPLKEVRGRGYLVLPEDAGPGPYPAVILLHSSLGVGSLEWDFARQVLAQGQAVLLVDSFTGRGLTKIDKDQMAVSEVSILYDLYSAQRFLAVNPRIDASRIAVAGFSKGGLPALYSSFNDIYRRFGYQYDPFSSHLAFYPWCGLTPRDLSLSGRPVEVHSGADDVITPAALCGQLLNAAQNVNPQAQIEFYTYPGMRHGFTHPDLGHISLPVTYPYPRNCRIVERADGTFVETSSGQVITDDNLSSVIGACSDKGAWVSGGESAGELAYRRALAFLGRANKIRR